MDSLFTFLCEDGVEPANNLAERTIRFGVLWKKRSQGTQSDKGCRWRERILSLRQSCKLQCKSTFNVLVDAFSAYFKGQRPDFEWITNLVMEIPCDRLRSYYAEKIMKLDEFRTSRFSGLATRSPLTSNVRLKNF